MSLNFCPKCGKKLDNQSDVCQHCAIDLSKRAQNEITSLKKVDLADFTIRALAWFIDMVLILSVVIPLSLYANFGYFYIYTNIYLFIIGFFYFFLFEYLNSGKTIGKMILRIKSVDNKTFKKAKLTQYFLNNVTKANPFVLIDVLFGIILNLSSQEPHKNDMRITQKISEISVIKVKK